MRSSQFKIAAFLLLTAVVASVSAAQSSSQPTVISIDLSAPAQPFPHFWEHMFGSGRANLTLRDSYRRDLREVKQITDLRYVRFHGIFLDDMGVYDEDAQGRPVYNFSYVDQAYDGLLAIGVRPFVELSFMPYKLASKPVLQAFWYHPNVAPPKDWAKWDDLIDHFTRHLVDRYGIDEVSKWYFEVWNEPNLDFWAGVPSQPTYWELYDHTARDIKRVSERLRVGGPATAQAAWADAFIRHCAQNHVPADFVSTHVYGNDKSQDVFGTNDDIPRDRMVCRAVRKVHDQIKASAMPNLPLIWSEFNASYKNETEVTDSTYMGPWMADTIRQCDGLVDEMSYWTFSDVFEEQGVVKQPFYGGFGLITAGGIPKAAYAAFAALHLLGDKRIPLNSDSALVTERGDGTLVVAAWNLTPPGQENGPEKTFSFQLKGMRDTGPAQIWRVDHEHGDPRPAYAKMGSPRYPTQEQVNELRSVASEPSPEALSLHDGQFAVSIPAQGLVVIEIPQLQK
ncbi:MAG TPA: glycosyl hydrolase family 39 [Terriglobales bacterium]|nr:glycosyl hydrolase family 39 [Terriglobales bacterium]